MFLFVNTFPTPPPQPTGQFSASLNYGTVAGVGTVISTVKISHLAGPTLYNTGSTSIWLISAAKPSAFSGPFTISQGLSGLTSWSIGQTWSVNITSYHIQTPDNLTISIISANQLLFRTTIPGSNPSIPPQFTTTGTVPANPNVNVPFKVFVQVVDRNLNPSTPNAVMINFSLLPGDTTSPPAAMTYSASDGTFSYSFPGVAPAGTYYVFVTAMDSVGLSNTVAIPITIGSSTGGGGQGPVLVQIQLNRSAPVSQLATLIFATVTDESSTGGSVAVSFFVNSALIGTATGTVSPGSSLTLSQGWTPGPVGTAVVAAQALVTGVGGGNASVSFTVFPTILLFAHNTAYSSGGSVKPLVTSADEASWLAYALTAAGVPFTTTALSCKSALPTSSNGIYTGQTVIIVDYGSSTSTGCTGGIMGTDGTTLASLAGAHDVWVVGANAWSTSTACTSVPAGFQTAFGLKVASSGACATAVTLPSTTGAFTSTGSLGLRGDAIASPYTVNKTVVGNATFQAFSLAGAFQNGASAHTFFTIGGSTAISGTFTAGASFRAMVTGFDPSTLVRPLPGGLSYGHGAAAAEVVYNTVNYLAGLTTPPNTTTPNRPGPDFSVAEVKVLGTSHSSTSTIYADIRANGLVGGPVTVTLLMNGTPAFYAGTTVSVVYVFAANTVASVFLALTWQAPSGGPFTLTVVVSAPSDLYSPNNLATPTPLGTTTTFS